MGSGAAERVVIFLDKRMVERFYGEVFDAFDLRLKRLSPRDFVSSVLVDPEIKEGSWCR